jgi:carboxymethylenebutenolidase
MYEKEVIVTTKYGQCPSFVACPEGPGPFPGVIFYMDAPGIREELRNMTRRIARQGYFAILPDMYYRLGTCASTSRAATRRWRPYSSARCAA